MSELTGALNSVRHLRSLIEPLFQNDFIYNLPKEIARNVMRFLSPANIARISSLACGYWRTLAEDNRLWREKCEEINVNDGKCERVSVVALHGRKWLVLVVLKSSDIALLRAAHAHCCYSHTHGLTIQKYFLFIRQYRFVVFTEGVQPTTALEKTPSKSNTLHTMEYGMPDAEVGGAIGIDLDW
ncbi:F-box/WD repeat-containing protein 7 [Toxocara canis]|uniref:F-box/WD repeat-containing protein 7 n=1 Tax=Toxocara canis TaxID=6265 RepID=A0A0B2V3I9_TOXCA|nr:F-box/WD repeat-containing protein 7 [Toxocara canis]